MTIFLKFWAILGHLEPFLGTHKIRTFSQALFPLQWLFVSSFHAQTYIIYKKWHFLAKFSPNGGHFGYPDYSKYVFSNVFLYYVCRKDFWRNNYLFHGIIVEKWPFLWNFELFWAILGRFEPFLGTQNFWIVVPCIIYPLMTFCQQLSGINIVFHAFLIPKQWILG